MDSNVWVLMAQGYNPHGTPIGGPMPQATFETRPLAEKFLGQWRSSPVNRHTKMWLHCVKFYEEKG